MPSELSYGPLFRFKNGLEIVFCRRALEGHCSSPVCDTCSGSGAVMSAAQAGISDATLRHLHSLQLRTASRMVMNQKSDE